MPRQQVADLWREGRPSYTAKGMCSVLSTSDVFEGYHREHSTLTMSSREIADLTGKEHKNVLADIRNMLEKLGKTSADFSADLPDAYGRIQPGFKLDRELTMTLVSGYDIPLPQIEEVPNDGPGPKTISIYNLCKRDSLIVVAQLCPEFTARIVDRWQELEEKTGICTLSIPKTLPEALRLAFTHW